MHQSPDTLKHILLNPFPWQEGIAYKCLFCIWDLYDMYLPSVLMGSCTLWLSPFHWHWEEKAALTDSIIVHDNAHFHLENPYKGRGLSWRHISSLNSLFSVLMYTVMPEEYMKGISRVFELAYSILFDLQTLLIPSQVSEFSLFIKTSDTGDHAGKDALRVMQHFSSIACYSCSGLNQAQALTCLLCRSRKRWSTKCGVRRHLSATLACPSMVKNSRSCLWGLEWKWASMKAGQIVSVPIPLQGGQTTSDPLSTGTSFVLHFDPCMTSLHWTSYHLEGIGCIPAPVY